MRSLTISLGASTCSLLLQEPRQNDASNVIDLHMAQCMGLQFHQPLSWCTFHFGNLPPECFVFFFKKKKLGDNSMIWVKNLIFLFSRGKSPLYRVPAPNTQQRTVRRTGPAHCVDSLSKNVSPLHLSYWRQRNRTLQNNQRQTNAVSSTQGASSAETEVHCHDSMCAIIVHIMQPSVFRVLGTKLIRGLTKSSVTIVENSTSLGPHTARAVGPFLQHQ